MADKRTIATPVKAIYSPEGQVLATNIENEEKEERWIDPPFYRDVEKLEKGKFYIFDEWLLKGHKLRIFGFYDEEGILQSSMYVADHDGSPHSLVKPEEESGVLFARMCQHLNIPAHIDQ